MALFGKKKQSNDPKYPGIRTVINGAKAIILCESNASEAASFVFSSPITEMAALWNQEKDNGHLSISGRTLISMPTESDQAAVTAATGSALSGLRTTLFNSSTQNSVVMHESLSAATGKKTPFVFNMLCTATTKTGSSDSCSHDDYHSISNTGLIQIFAHNVQSSADLNLIARKASELSLNPALLAQDKYLTSHSLETIHLPEPELIREFIGLSNDTIPSPTPSQTILFGKTRRRIPRTWTIDQPIQSGGLHNAESYMPSVAGQRPYFFDHVASIIDQCMEEWHTLTGRKYSRAIPYQCDDADYLLLAQGSIVNHAESVAEYLREYKKIKVGVINLTLFRPFPGDLLSNLFKGKKAICVLERTDLPLAEDLPIIAECRASISKALENGQSKQPCYGGYASYSKTTDAPKLYSACYGLGGSAVSSNDILAAVENMLPEGRQQRFAYLGINFTHQQNISPQQEIYQFTLLESYPDIQELVLSSNDISPNTTNKQQTLCIHSQDGWDSNGFIEKLAEALHKHYLFNIKTHTDNYQDTKGQPQRALIASSTSIIKDNIAFNVVDIAIAIDQHSFSYCDPLLNLKSNGLLILQSRFSNAIDVWQSIPLEAQNAIVENDIKVLYLDAYELVKLTLNQDSTPNQKTNVIHTVFLAASLNKLSKEDQDNLSNEQIAKYLNTETSFVSSCINALSEIFPDHMNVGDSKNLLSVEVHPPKLLQQQAENDNAIANIHRFWNQIGNHYQHPAEQQANVADPFMSLGIVPASTGIFGDLTSNRQQHPLWMAENCTACGQCFNACPDSAIPGLVNTVNEVFETNIKRIEKSGNIVKHLRRAIRTVEKKYHELTQDKTVGTNLDPIFAKAIGDTIKEYPESDQEEVAQEFEWFKNTVGDFKFALTEPYHDEMNSHMPRNGGLFSITIDPNSCKGCMECVSVCEDNALKVVEQNDETVTLLRKNWDYWLDLPTSNKKFSRIDNLQAKQGVLSTLLLDKRNHTTMFNSDRTRRGSGEKTAIHLFTSTVTALMQPRVEQHIKKINQLIIDLEKHIRLQLVQTMDISDIDALESAIDENQNVDLTLSRLSGTLDKNKPTQPIDPEWLKWILNIISQLKQLKWRYQHGESGQGRAQLGIAESGHPSASRSSRFPFNPYPFPWARHLSIDAPSLAMGLFEGHMQNMADGFKAIRIAELEIKGKYDKSEHDHFFAQFDWRQFNDEEFELCPPIVTISADGMGFEPGLQNLSHGLMSGLPIKILVLNNHLQSMSSQNKELGLIAMAHRTAFVHQSALSSMTHLLEGYVDGINFKGPTLWSIYTSSQPETALAKPSITMQSRIAMESRAYPLFSFNPAAGTNWEQCLTLAGNPDIDQDWVSYELNYTDEYGNQFSKDITLSYADWALTKSELADHFTPFPAEKNDSSMVPLPEFIDMSESAQKGKTPFIWAVHPDTNHLFKVGVSEAMVKTTLERRHFWQTLKGLTGDSRVEIDTQAIADQARAEMAQSITEGLVSMVNGDSGILSRILSDVPAISATQPSPVAEKQTPSKPAAVQSEKEKPKTVTKKESPNKENSKPASDKNAKPAPSDSGLPAHEPVWIETPDCTTCDECVEIAPEIFQYNDEKKAIVIDPTKGTYEDIVRSAEKCTAVIIHPGTPWNPDEPNLEELIKRAEKFQ